MAAIRVVELMGHPVQPLVGVDHYRFRRGKALAFFQFPRKIKVRRAAQHPHGAHHGKLCFHCKGAGENEIEAVNLAPVFVGAVGGKNQKRVGGGGGCAVFGADLGYAVADRGAIQLKFLCPRAVRGNDVKITAGQIHRKAECPVKEHRTLAVVDIFHPARNRVQVVINGVVQAYGKGVHFVGKLHHQRLALAKRG